MECPQSIKLALERRDVIFQFLNVVHYGLPQFDDEIDWRSGAALAVSYLFFERERAIGTDGPHYFSPRQRLAVDSDAGPHLHGAVTRLIIFGGARHSFGHAGFFTFEIIFKCGTTAVGVLSPIPGGRCDAPAYPIVIPLLARRMAPAAALIMSSC